MKNITLCLMLAIASVAVGQTSFTCIVTTNPSAMACVPTTIPIPPTPTPLVISTTTLPNGTVGTAYSATLSATGGTAPYTWTSPALPAGLSMSTVGVISGTPTVSAINAFTITVKDSAAIPQTTTTTLALNIAPASVTPPPSGSLATAYASYIAKYASYATQYYVSPSGSGTTCTSAAPCSISTGVGKVSAGAVVWLANGTYSTSSLSSCGGNRASLAMCGSGTASSHAAIAAQNYGMAQIVFSSSAANGWPVLLAQGNYVDVLGLDVSTTDGNSCGGIDPYGNYNVIAYNRVHDILGATSTCGNGAGGFGIASSTTSTGNTIYANMAWNIGGSGNQWMHCYYVDGNGTTIQNNIAYNCSGAALQCYHNCQNETITNNTFVNGKTFGIVAGAYQYPTMSGMVIANNIVEGSPMGFMECDGSNCVAATGSNVCTNNNFYNNSVLTKNVTCSNTVTGNPNFVNNAAPPAGNFALQSGSPASGAGTGTNAPATDIMGTPRTPKVSIGAYQ